MWLGGSESLTVCVCALNNQHHVNIIVGCKSGMNENVYCRDEYLEGQVFVATINQSDERVCLDVAISRESVLHKTWLQEQLAF